MEHHLVPLHDSILDTIGRTPIIKLHRMGPDHTTVYVKAESFNPGGSVKDRLALAVVLDAEARGLLKPGDTMIECTSGNVGIALSMVAAARGYKFVAVMGDTYSVERRKLIRAYGGKVILFPGSLGSSGGNQIADELAEKHGWFRPRQFDNPANPAFHRETTAAEILSDFAGKRLDYFVTGFGTSGTLTGVGQMLKVARPAVKIIATEPANAALLSGKPWNVHRIQGLAPNFVPTVLDQTVIDELTTIDEIVARDTARRLAAEEGIFAGISSGATLATALRIAEDAPEGSVFLAMLPDTGERYLSTFWFEGVEEGSDDAWLDSLEPTVESSAMEEIHA
ncbi:MULTISPECIES: cysteine synthase A [unclassified Cryobacterium]|uniref:cysteine synthase A n=1 Tax=unclassified Cryobacterium TaxID=2649013 RepID=UPI001068D561|nr:MULTISPECIES: cysteine synthase A [unclassified Cryobacterium]TFC10972.1 cysteine synthase A [Cryobacterium sp. MDB2-33-2]TFC32100.1 cysteine synthase A [Cryobacterium sp. MDB1-18-2]TFC42034.1 cysteine synthase A [Cryobacterium sp. MDB1-18-1]TFB92292.1 cysteine synthase A [Cryobacterium sp. MDB2-A-1]TFC16089.1 cysteine synthase A [Cryobacterium sp. MDB2-A-2]